MNRGCVQFVQLFFWKVVRLRNVRTNYRVIGFGEDAAVYQKLKHKST